MLTALGEPEHRIEGLEAGAGAPEIIATVWGVGYRLNASALDPPTVS